MHSKAMSPAIGGGLSVRSSAEGSVPLYNDQRPAVRSRLCHPKSAAVLSQF
ncbi:uncharacterized protein LACBIDRAFT_318931 [Laccaria bicolor S238N-H82]|uniref:Predicted protein n=1 Tax=Laccaria bicolor (strain S238N-H82 / ATCC MYA-4686) TaxID=486041 RepID=B0D7G6_LACBS|nr:uncharacterized protein LACBIDRAFT_318931 [Laccaria bicolor S238N-H82]EDR09393.1 predicted protein [Laccaria bicolor S238N-H82]|eukprot:XP_001879742.1 predicted protein [Laccaria bicolor S238N-H82]